jgi:6-phosphogluconolactonase
MTLLFAAGYSWTETPERGITVVSLESGAAEVYTDIPNPFHLLLGPGGRVLYVASNVAQGRVHALSVEDGVLRPIGDQPAGDGPVQLGMHPDGGHLVVVNHDSGDLVTYPIGPDGALGSAVQRCEHATPVPREGINPHAQGSPHPHMAVFDGPGTGLLVPDKGTDHVHVYRFDPATGQAVPRSQVFVGAGFGPRALVAHPSWRYVYVLGEIRSELLVCGYDPATQALWTLDAVPTVPAEGVEGNAPSGLAISPDGRFVYAANRGHDTIAVFAVRADGAVLERIGEVRVGEPVTTLPWELRFDPAGELLFVANQLSGTVLSFRVVEDGSLDPAGAELKIPGAASVAIG